MNGRETASACLQTNKLRKCCVNENDVTLECGHKLPLMSAACNKDNAGKIKEMPISTGYIGETEISVLRDTGCSGAVVKLDLVNKEQFTGETQHCVLIDGTVRKVPVAKVSVDTPYFRGEIQALCMKNPVYQLILGNLPGIRDPSDPDLSWKKQDYKCGQISNDDASMSQKHELQAVQTRAQRKKMEKPITKMKVSSPIENVNVDDIIREQNNDDSLKHVKQLAHSKTVQTKGRNRAKFLYSNNLLYREFQSPKIEHELFLPASCANIIQTTNIEIGT